MFAWFRAKDSSFVNSAAPYVGEFIARSRLAKIGFTTSFDDLDSVTGEVLLTIDGEFERFKADEMKKASKRKR